MKEQAYTEDGLRMSRQAHCAGQDPLAGRHDAPQCLADLPCLPCQASGGDRGQQGHRPHARSPLEPRSHVLWETRPSEKNSWDMDEEQVFSEKLPFQSIFA